MTHRLFSYGTLRQADVQAELFGAPIPATDDALPGWRLDWVTITAPDVIATSGSDRHPILRPGKPTDSVTGAWLELTDSQLNRADEYEVDDYVRVEATLASGLSCWIYVAAEDEPALPRS